MRKANALLAEARKYVESYKSEAAPAVDAKLAKARGYVAQKTATEPESGPVVEPVKVVTGKKGVRVDRAEIKKLKKGHFFVVLTYNGTRHEIQKRFKSTTKAKEWISNHEYITSR